jgi:hypothetical protein
MKTGTSKIHLIRDKLQAINSEIARLEDEIARLREQANDYVIAERVWASLGLEDEEIPRRATSTSSNGNDHLRPTSKPPGIPTMPDMIVEVLKRNDQLTDEVKSPSQVLEIIKKEWWPTATSTDISPVMWRMAKDGRLVRYPEGGYRLSPLIVKSTDGQNAA